jgi:hypothetical protein
VLICVPVLASQKWQKGQEAGSLDRLFQTTLVLSAQRRSAMFDNPSMRVQKTLQGIGILVVDLAVIIGAKMTLLHKNYLFND